jgi:hypothetical protein
MSGKSINFNYLTIFFTNFKNVRNNLSLIVK